MLPNDCYTILKAWQHPKLDRLHALPEGGVLHRQHGCSKHQNLHKRCQATDTGTGRLPAQQSLYRSMLLSKGPRRCGCLIQGVGQVVLRAIDHCHMRAGRSHSDAPAAELLCTSPCSSNEQCLLVMQQGASIPMSHSVPTART